jgi:phage-related baseplate assembly protein
VTIELGNLPAPLVVEALDFETIRAEMLSDLQDADPDFDALLPSDPGYKLLEVASYRELLLRARVNDAARSVLAAFAQGADLDHLVVLRGMLRIDDESDAHLLERYLASQAGSSVAGPRDAYRTLALAVEGVKDASISRPTPGTVQVTILSLAGDGTPDEPLLAAVASALGDAKVRPLNDTVVVAAAAVEHYSIVAALTVYDGPDAEVVRAAAEERATAYAAASHRLGRDITVTRVNAALAVDGVHSASIPTLTYDRVVAPSGAAYCDSVVVTIAGVAE